MHRSGGASLQNPMEAQVVWLLRLLDLAPQQETVKKQIGCVSFKGGWVENLRNLFGGLLGRCVFFCCLCPFIVSLIFVKHCSMTLCI